MKNIIFKGKKLVEWLKSVFIAQRFLCLKLLLNVFFIHEWNGWKQIPKVKKGLSCSLGNNHVFKWEIIGGHDCSLIKTSLSCSLGQLKLFLFGDMIIFKEKINLSCSLRQLKPQGHDYFQNKYKFNYFPRQLKFLPKDMIILQGKKKLKSLLGAT